METAGTRLEHPNTDVCFARHLPSPMGEEKKTGETNSVRAQEARIPGIGAEGLLLGFHKKKIHPRVTICYKATGAEVFPRLHM